MNCQIYSVSIFLRILYIPFNLVTGRECSGPLVRSILSPLILAGPISPLPSAARITPNHCAGSQGTAPAYSNQAQQPYGEGEGHASPSLSFSQGVSQHPSVIAGCLRWIDALCSTTTAGLYQVTPCEGLW